MLRLAGRAVPIRSSLNADGPVKLLAKRSVVFARHKGRANQMEKLMATEKQPAKVIADCIGVGRAQAVWDFTTGDVRRFRDRLDLVIDAAEQFKQQNIATDFVAILHGHATQFAARTLFGTKFTEPETPDFPAAHALMRRFTALGGRIEVCGIAMERCAIAAENLIDCVTVERNVFVNSIALQNRGYAYMPIT
jgi:intracellular sulfur oxidation DsrE/DsrF family protein